MEKFTPDRSKKFKEDTKGVPYKIGNRKARLIAKAGIKHRSKRINKKLQNETYKGPKLPKAMWKKNKSKFLGHRLREEKVLSINQL